MARDRIEQKRDYSKARERVSQKMAKLYYQKRTASPKCMSGSGHLHRDDDEKLTSMEDVDSVSSLNLNAGIDKTVNRKETFERKSSSRKLTSMAEDLGSNISSRSVNTGTSRIILRKELHTRQTSLTVREVSFLNDLIQSSDVNAAQLKQITKVLGNPKIFFDCDKKESSISQGHLHHSSPARLEDQLLSSKRLSALNVRRSSTIHRHLWQLHEKGISTNSSLNFRSSFHARRSMRSLCCRNVLYSDGTRLLNTSKEKSRNIFKFDNVLTLVAQQVNSSAPSIYSSGRAQEKHQLTQKVVNEIVTTPRPSSTQLETLEEEGSYRFYNCEVVAQQARDEIYIKDGRKMSLVDVIQHGTSNQQCLDPYSKEWWENSNVELNDSMVDIVRESCEATASLPVVLRSYGDHSLPSRNNLTPNINRAYALRSSSSLSFEQSDLLSAGMSSPTGVSSVGKTSIAYIHRACPLRSFSRSSTLRSGSMRSLDDIDLERSFRRTGHSSKQLSSMLRDNPKSLQRNSSLVSQVSFKGTQQPLDDVSAVARPIRLVTREASLNVYAGEGFEVMDPLADQNFYVSSHLFSDQTKSNSIKAPETLRKMPALFQANESNLGSGQENLSNSRKMAREKSDSTMSAVERIWCYDVPNMDIRVEENDASWDMDDDDEDKKDGLPVGVDGAWQVLNDDSILGMSYGGGGTLPFLILGTSASDKSAQPHVLSPPLMESLQSFLPNKLLECNFWLKYSLVRDGSSLTSLLQHVRGSNYTILAVETIEGEVFGCFTSTPWRKTWGFFGSGQSFLWRMRESRAISSKSVIDQARRESEIDVFPWSGNDMIQICRNDMIAVGGGFQQKNGSSSGFGLALEADLLRGSTNPCVTFDSPRLSHHGDLFEVVNMEVWTLTPFTTELEAEKMELTHLFLEGYDQ